MMYIYRNDNNYAVAYAGFLWQTGDTLNVPFPVPDSLGLTCLVQGRPPDPVLFHDDIIIPAGAQAVAVFAEPLLSHNVALSIECMSINSGVECRFGARDNNPVPIDARGFVHVLSWELCSRLFFRNTTENEAVISVSAVEVIR
ncbi:MAG: hypothetical protein IJQ24_12810 [Synergistaceae bacterium]|nr:hypothetical protein [Synergistaceae bacterium]